MVFDGKKGQFVQLVIGVVFIFALLFVYLFGYRAFAGINDEFQLDAEFTNESKVIMQQAEDTYPSVFDGVVVFLFVAVWILCVVLAYQSGSNPVLAVFAFILVAVLGVVGMFLSNAWSEVSGGDMAEFSGAFPMSNFLLSNYLVVVLVVGFSTVIVGVSRMGGGF